MRLLQHTAGDGVEEHGREAVEAVEQYLGEVRPAFGAQAHPAVSGQVGHAYAATTAIYTAVSDDYKNRVLAATLAPAFAPGQPSREGGR